MKKLCVCIPTYNRITYLRKQAEKLVAMVMPHQNDVEFIISDNASTDGTWNYLLDLHERFPFIIINHNEKNLGLNGNFLTLINMANSEYIWLVSDDDNVNDNTLEKVMDILQRHSDIGLVFLNELTVLSDNPIVYTGEQEFYPDGLDMMVAIGKKDNAFNRFTVITEMVLKKSNILEATKLISENDSFNNLALPLAWAIESCANSSAFVTKDVYIQEGGDDREAKSWKESREKFACVDIFKTIEIMGEKKGIKDRINCDLIINRVRYAEVRWTLMELKYKLNRNEYGQLKNVALDYMWRNHKIRTIADYVSFPFFVIKRGLPILFNKAKFIKNNGGLT